MDGLTPVEHFAKVVTLLGTKSLWVKRDDMFTVNGISGGKVRTCLRLATSAKAVGLTELVTAGSRHSPQVSIVARVAQHLDMKATVFVPWSKQDDTPEITDARKHGADVQLIRPGHNSVIIARARDYTVRTVGATEIPFGMECRMAVEETATQVHNVLQLYRDGEINQIVVPVGSGMSLAGIVKGIRESEMEIPPITGIVVGADPTKRLDSYAPQWRSYVTLKSAGMDYSERVHVALDFERSIWLDPVYEAKAALHCQDEDLLWVVGARVGYGERK